MYVCMWQTLHPISIGPENKDFILAVPLCQSIRFQRKCGIQKECAFIRIFENSAKENERQFSERQFSVRLVLHKPYVASGISTATVTIKKSAATAIVPTPLVTVTTPTPFESKCKSIIKRLLFDQLDIDEELKNSLRMILFTLILFSQI